MKGKYVKFAAIMIFFAAFAALGFFIFDDYIVTDETFIDYFSIGHFCVWTLVGVIIGVYAQKKPKSRVKIFGITLSLIILMFIIAMIGVFYEIYEQLGWGEAILMTPDAKFNVLTDIIINCTAFTFAFWWMSSK